MAISTDLAGGSAQASGARGAAAALASRVVPVDILRGLVLLVLLPDLTGGFSFYRMAERHPDSSVWVPLAAQFRHVEWTGVALWDLVMPLFVFLIGVSMALSYQRRIDSGQDRRTLLVHALLRSLTLVVLGLLLQFEPKRSFDELLPYLVLSTGLPLEEWWPWRGTDPQARHASWGIVLYRWAVVLAAGCWMFLHVEQLGDYQANQILILVGLACMPAFLLVGCSTRVQAWAIVAILGAYGLAFTLHAPSPDAVPVGESFSGLFAHWNNGTNLGAAFDHWLFGVLPRAVPYQGNPHGYHTLAFIPLIALMVAGAMVGRAIGRTAAPRPLAMRLAAMAVAGLLAGWLMSLTVFPLVKSLWTPSW